jgi:hypothetical protein
MTRLSAVKITTAGATPRKGCFKDWERWIGSFLTKEFLLRCEMRLIVLCLFAALTAGARSTTEHLLLTDAEKIADALKAVQNFITEQATIVDYPLSRT